MSELLLRRAIQADATGVGLLGLGAVTYAGPLARLSGLTPIQCYITAASFLLYGVLGNVLARRPRVRGFGIGLSAFNFTGTIGAVALVASNALPLTGTGKAIVLGCGLYTLVFGLLQATGVRRMSAGAPPLSGVQPHCRSARWIQ